MTQAATQYKILYWRDIPAQIKFYGQGRPVAHALPSRFQVLIDRVAMEEGLTGTDAYLEQWHWGPKQDHDGDQDSLVARIEADHAHLFAKTPPEDTP